MSMSTLNQSALEQAVEEAVRIHDKQRFDREAVKFVCSFNLSTYNGSYPDLHVKYGAPLLDLQAEYAMLQHLSSLARDDSDAAPHVPQPLYCFELSDDGWAYLITRHVAVREVSESELLIKSAEALKWLHSKSAPAGTGTIFGHIGNKCYALHDVFDQSKAPLMFTSLSAVERYFNEGIRRILEQSEYMRPLSDVSFANEKLILSQSYMDPKHFGIALDGRPVLFGVMSIQAMPQIFVDFTLFKTTDFAADLSQILYNDEEIDKILESEAMVSLPAVSVYLLRHFDKNLQLDDDGNLLPRETFH